MVSENSSTYFRDSRRAERRGGIRDWSVHSDPRGVYWPREYSVAMPVRRPSRRPRGVRSHTAPPWQAGHHTYNWLILGISGGAVVAMIILILVEVVGRLDG